MRRQNGRAAAGGAVRLMTLHGAKGLEFPLVFLAGLGQGMLPLERQGEHADLEEERRLFFVGLTRARDELVLTVPGQASCFAAELPEKVERLSARALKPQPQAQQLSFF